MKPKCDEDIVLVGDSGALTVEGKLSTHWQVPLLSLLNAVARRMEYGGAETGYPVLNWREGLGDIKFLRARFSSMLRHLCKFAANKESDPESQQQHLDAIAWAVALLCEAMAEQPDKVREAFYSKPRGEKA